MNNQNAIEKTKKKIATQGDQINAFFRHFLIAFVVITILMLPIQWALSAIGGIRLFGGTERLISDMPVLAVQDSDLSELYGQSKRVNVLVMGVNDGLTDTLMLASYDLKNQKVDVISVPRDTYYKREGYESIAAQKINAIYANDKAAGTALAVSDVLFGMPVNYYVVIKYDAVEKVVDSMGGVPMNIPFHMQYKDPYDKPPLIVDIPEGEQVLDGKQAVQFLRFRKGSSGHPGYPEGDIGRVKAQQEFVKSAFKQAMGPDLPKVTKTVLTNVDSDLPLGMAVKLATNAIGLDSNDIEMHVTPGESGTRNGLSFWLVDEDAAMLMVEEIYTPEE